MGKEQQRNSTKKYNKQQQQQQQQQVLKNDKNNRHNKESNRICNFLLLPLVQTKIFFVDPTTEKRTTGVNWKRPSRI